ncbi:MAG: hypothetical protein WBO04_17370 [Steroidobacteraceae bacterium]
MTCNERHKATSITVPLQSDQQFEQLYRNESLGLVFGSQARGAQDRRVADLGAFTEWDSELDRAYDVLADEAP